MKLLLRLLSLQDRFRYYFHYFRLHKILKQLLIKIINIENILKKQLILISKQIFFNKSLRSLCFILLMMINV